MRLHFALVSVIFVLVSACTSNQTKVYQYPKPLYAELEIEVEGQWKKQWRKTYHYQENSEREDDE